MEIHQWNSNKKIIGNNSNNNEVKIDFENKTVAFNPVDNYSLFHCWHSLSHTIGFILSIFSVYITIPLIFIFHDSSILVVGFIFAYLIGYTTSLFVLYKPARTNLYPKVNGWLQEFYYFITWRPRKWITYIDVGDNNTISFPFQNIVLKYKVSGDFSTQLKIIDIKAEKQIIKRNNKIVTMWMCNFIFKRKPKGGYLKVKYC